MGIAVTPLGSPCPRFGEHQIESYMEIEGINFLCPSCTHLGPAVIPCESKQFDCPDQREHPDDVIWFLVALRCADNNCESHVLSLARLRRDTDDLSAVMANWKDTGVQCQQGHPLQKPFQSVQKVALTKA